jgi:hypothetical protein
VALAACHIKLDLSALPSQSDELGVGFGMGVGNNKKPQLLIYPGAGAPAEPPQVRYAVYMRLALGDGTRAGDLGQLLVSGQRLIGMMTHGSAAGSKLSASAGSVYAFTLSLADIEPARTKAKWTGRVAGVILQSRTEQNPGFMLEVTSVVGALADSGQLTYGASFADVANSLTAVQG